MTEGAYSWQQADGTLLLLLLQLLLQPDKARRGMWSGVQGDWTGADRSWARGGARLGQVEGRVVGRSRRLLSTVSCRHERHARPLGTQRRGWKSGAPFTPFPHLLGPLMLLPRTDLIGIY